MKYSHREMKIREIRCQCDRSLEQWGMPSFQLPEQHNGILSGQRTVKDTGPWALVVEQEGCRIQTAPCLEFSAHKLGQLSSTFVKIFKYRDSKSKHRICNNISYKCLQCQFERNPFKSLIYLLPFSYLVPRANEIKLFSMRSVSLTSKIAIPLI